VANRNEMRVPGSTAAANVAVVHVFVIILLVNMDCFQRFFQLFIPRWTSENAGI